MVIDDVARAGDLWEIEVQLLKTERCKRCKKCFVCQILSTYANGESTGDLVWFKRSRYDVRLRCKVYVPLYKSFKHKRQPKHRQLTLC